MTTVDDKQVNLNEQAQGADKNKPGNKMNVDQEKTTTKGPEPDTEPDEFISPNADTDLPINGEVINDAVLRGEPKADDIAYNWPPKDKSKEAKSSSKKDAEKKQ
jgi:hypothetical protein